MITTDEQFDILSYKKMNCLKEKIQFLLKHKSLSSRKARSRGQVTIAQMNELIGEFISNLKNRFEDMEDENLYENRLAHLIRFVCGISEKGQMFLAVYNNTDEYQFAMIGDMGTLLALALVDGKYYDRCVLTGTAWVKLLDKIVGFYEINRQQDLIFINMIRKYFEDFDQTEMKKKYSLKDVVESNDEIKDFYNSTNFSYSLNLWSEHQATMDMIQCNLQPHPWETEDYMLSHVKGTTAFENIFKGTEIVEVYLNDKDGASKFGKGRICSKMAGSVSKSLVRRIRIPFQTYIISEFVSSVPLLIDSFDRITNFTEKEMQKNGFWVDEMKQLSTIRSEDFKNWYEKKYLEVYMHHFSDDMIEAWKDIANHNGFSIERVSWEGICPKKSDTGAGIISTVLWFHKYSGQSIDTIGDLVFQHYVNIIENRYVQIDKNSYKNSVEETPKYIQDKWTNEVWPNNQVPVWYYFGPGSEYLKSTSTNQRIEHLFGPLIEEVDNDVTNTQSDRAKSTLKARRLREPIINYVKNDCKHHRLTLAPLISKENGTNEIHTYKLQGDHLPGFHPIPLTENGNGDDLFIGLKHDNQGDWQYKHWKKDDGSLYDQDTYFIELWQYNYTLFNENENDPDLNESPAHHQHKLSVGYLGAYITENCG
jgi:hypothetical protein